MLSVTKKYHLTLASYFSSQPHFFDGNQQKKPQIRKCMELPYQQTKAKLWDEVTDTLCDLEFIQAKACAKMTYDLVKDFNSVLLEIPENAENIKEDNKLQTRINKYTQDLIAYGKGEVVKLEVPETVPLWSEERINIEIDRMKTNPTQLDRLNGFKNFIGQESVNLQNYANEFQNFALQQAWNFADSGPVGISAEKTSKDKYESLLLCMDPFRPYWNPMTQCIITLKRKYSDVVTNVTFTSDGKKAFTCCANKTCTLWDLNTGQVINTLYAYSGLSYGAAITPDGKKAVTGFKKFCVIWDMNSENPVLTLKGHTEFVHSVYISPDGKMAISGSFDKTCIIWDLNTGKAIQTLKDGHTATVNAVFLCSDQKKVISLSTQECILWDIDSGQPLQTFRISTFNSTTKISITPDGQKALFKNDSTCCILLNLEQSSVTSLRGHTKIISAHDITPDGKFAITGSFDNTCIVWDLCTGQMVYTLTGHTDTVNAVAITPDGKRAISGSSDNTCIIWDLQTGMIIRTLAGHSSIINSVAITPDGKRALSGSSDETCILWDLNFVAGKHKLKVHSDVVRSFVVIPNGKKIISSSEDSTCILWDVLTGRIEYTLNMKNGFAKVIAITPDGKKAILNSRELTFKYPGDENCTIWDLETGQSFNTLKEHTGNVNTIAITPDGNRAITSSFDKTCIIWDLATFQPLKKLQVDSSHFFSDVKVNPSGNQAILSPYSSKLFFISDLDSGETIQTIEGQSGAFNPIAVTPDGKMVITGSEENNCIIRDLTTGCQVNILKGHSSPICHIIITPDGKKVISYSEDNDNILWDLKTSQILRHFSCGLVGAITPDNKWALIISAFKTLEIWDLESGERKGLFTSNSLITAVSFFQSGVFIGEESGKINILKNKKFLCPLRSILTIRKIWDFEDKKFQEASADCPLCGHRFAPRSSVLDAIQDLAKKTGLRPEQSACLELPDEAWEDPGLLGNCPKCGEELKFNPFVAGGET